MLPGNQILGFGCLGALQEDVVIRVFGFRKLCSGFYHGAGLTDLLEQQGSAAGIHRIAFAPEQFLVLVQDGLGSLEVDGSGQGQLQDPKRQSVFVEVGRDDDVGIQNNPAHLAGVVTAVFCRRSLPAAAISASICRMVSLFRPLRLASAPLRWLSAILAWAQKCRCSRQCS